MITKHLGTAAEKETQKLHDKVGLFWAFGDDQFKEGLKKIEDNGILSKGDKLTSIGMGGYLPSKNVKEFIEEGEQIYQKTALMLKQEHGRTALIEFELANHECRYTGSYEAALEPLDIYFDEGENKEAIVRAVFYRIIALYGWG